MTTQDRQDTTQPPAPLQPLFDAAVHGVLRQGCYSQIRLGDGVTRCRYRQFAVTSDPVRCAVGHLIPDAVYRPDFERRGQWTAVVEAIRAAWAPPYVSPEKLEVFLAELQKCHDDPASKDGAELSEFRANARALADRWGLSAAVCDEGMSPRAQLMRLAIQMSSELSRPDWEGATVRELALRVLLAALDVPDEGASPRDLILEAYAHYQRAQAAAPLAPVAPVASVADLGAARG